MFIQIELINACGALYLKGDVKSAGSKTGEYELSYCGGELNTGFHSPDLTIKMIPNQGSSVNIIFRCKNDLPHNLVISAEQSFLTCVGSATDENKFKWKTSSSEGFIYISTFSNLMFIIRDKNKMEDVESCEYWSPSPKAYMCPIVNNGKYGLLETEHRIKHKSNSLLRTEKVNNVNFNYNWN